MYAALFLVGALLPAADPKPTDREALKPFESLIGAWKGTGYPEGTREERQKGAWAERIEWGWRFKGDRAWLAVSFENGKHFASGTLEPIPDKPAGYKLTLTAPDKSACEFVGTLKDGALKADRAPAAGQEEQRVVISLLHRNRYLYRYETKPAGGFGFAKKYMVGATKEGEAFAEAAKGPECIVTGGKGTSKVTYKGADYWVCCSGCRDAFKDDPEKFVKEAASKAKK